MHLFNYHIYLERREHLWLAFYLKFWSKVSLEFCSFIHTLATLILIAFYCSLYMYSYIHITCQPVKCFDQERQTPELIFYKLLPCVRDIVCVVRPVQMLETMGAGAGLLVLDNNFYEGAVKNKDGILCFVSWYFPCREQHILFPFHIYTNN